MSNELRRTLPLVIATVVGVFMFANFFLDLPRAHANSNMKNQNYSRSPTENRWSC